jgi:hypothetical protein
MRSAVVLIVVAPKKMSLSYSLKQQLLLRGMRSLRFSLWQQQITSSWAKSYKTLNAVI